MITQSLYARYLKLSQDPDSGIAPPGYSTDKVSFMLELAIDGKPLRIVDLRVAAGKRSVPVSMNVPEHTARSSAVKPYFLCDKAEYVLGLLTKSGARATSVTKFAASRELHRTLLQDCKSSDGRAALLFFDRWNPEEPEGDEQFHMMLEKVLSSTDNNFIFKLQDSSYSVHQSKETMRLWADYIKKDKLGAVYGTCLVTGEKNRRIARTHEIKIKGVADAQSVGANLVSFNFPAVLSYGKEQSYNAPISEEASAGYAKALNQLLASRNNRLRSVGEMTVVFWANRTPERDLEWEVQEGIFSNFFNDSFDEDNENSLISMRIQELLVHVRSGVPLTEEMYSALETPFSVLGLSPNAARLAVRYYWQGTFGSLIAHLAEHAADMAMSRPGGKPLSQPSLSRVMRETVHFSLETSKMKKMTAAMAGAWFRSILQGSAYPYSVYAAIIGRIRADRRISPYGDNAGSAWVRASVIKAYLQRYARLHHNTELEGALTVELNENEQTQPTAYRLGRLFAVLERSQIETSGIYYRLNTTFRERFFSSALTSPQVVFPKLIRLGQEHIYSPEAKYGQYRDQEVAAILSEISVFPAHLNLEEQGLFILGYYHQAQRSFNLKRMGSWADSADPSLVEDKGENEA
ncbi:type I-C CRISPR-associated protein Cas8c/Csd1 [Paenibacillus albidus]|uniref:type I-C CRISPR-associated protein Cas8c/Csd1 n=1 Tax=Paenibacillus albidus TaxID=2041023 RepID=UPI001BE61C4F|nr:type I-C CRISPR-associated protein Cas8c/Csd1 [Paenibacillus albidus]MBT2291457.1 type I-C CRISPR-associated protein Cas8c/Csd1 [Paenibacillus albidus]